MPSYSIRVNGFTRTVDSSDPNQPLLYVLRDFGLTAAKFGCGLGQCGACNVLIDGRAVPSCTTSIADAQGKSITTLEGIGSTSTPHPVQAAFIKEQVPQCGYCTSGMIVSAVGAVVRKAEADGSGSPLRARRKSLPLRHPCAGRARGDDGIGAGRLT